MKKVAVFISHPIQYQVPLFKRLAVEPGVDLTVFFFWDFGVQETYDPQFGQKVKWDIPLLDGYKSEFLKNISPDKTSAHFFGEANPELFSRIINGHYDAMIVFGWQTISHWCAIVTGFLTGTPIFIRGENPFYQEPEKSFLKRIIKHIVLRGLFKLAAGFFYIGEENRKFYRYYGVPDSKLHFVPYAADNDRFMAEAKKLKPMKDGLKRKLGIQKQQNIILFSGKLVNGKRPLDLIMAYEKLVREILKKRGAKPALVFVGNGPIKSDLEEYAKKNMLDQIYFVGFKNQNELPEFYAMADVFVLPSGGETWGLVVNEAMCFSIPVIVSSVVSCGKDLIIPGRNGYVFPVGDEKSLADCLQKVLEQDAVMKKMGKESFKIISRWNFTEDIKGMRKAMGIRNDF